MAIDVSVTAESVEIESANAYEVKVGLKEVQEDELLEHINVDTAINFYGVRVVLNAISRDDVLEHFGIEEVE